MTDSNPNSKTAPPTSTTTLATSQVTLPRITIEFCTQCKWNLRAAYFAQELLQTFGSSLGEVALMPKTGGVFVIKLFVAGGDLAESEGNGDAVKVLENLIWDRKVDGGFPETKELKNRVRNVIEPGRSLGHTDRALAKGKENTKDDKSGEQHEVKKQELENGQGQKEDCKDCP